MRLKQYPTKTIPLIFLAGLVLFCSYYLTQFVESHQETQVAIANLGYIGPILLALIFGLSVLIPFPPGTLAPVFSLAGLYLPLVVVMFTIGTTIADLAGYYFGRFSKSNFEIYYPRLYKKIISLQNSRPIYVKFFVFLLAGFMPLPNEAWIIPFGLIGFKLRSFIVPMIAGTITYHILTTYGTETLFSFFG